MLINMYFSYVKDCVLVLYITEFVYVGVFFFLDKTLLWKVYRKCCQVTIDLWQASKVFKTRHF